MNPDFQDSNAELSSEPGISVFKVHMRSPTETLKGRHLADIATGQCYIPLNGPEALREVDFRSCMTWKYNNKQHS
jgi:hypothetical protein